MIGASFTRTFVLYAENKLTWLSRLFRLWKLKRQKFSACLELSRSLSWNQGRIWHTTACLLQMFWWNAVAFGTPYFRSILGLHTVI